MSSSTTTSSKPFGLWPSPVTPARMATALRLSDVQFNFAGDRLVWLEVRAGHGVLVTAEVSKTGTLGSPRDLTDVLSVRGKVGYGGGEFGVGQDFVVFAEAKSGRLYRQPLVAGREHPLTPPFGGCASPVVSAGGHFVAYVHTDQRTDVLAVVDAHGKAWPQKLHSGADFYMQPAFDPSGSRLAVISWDHPHMPWDSTRLHLLTLDTRGELPRLESEALVYEDADAAVQQPRFSPDGTWIAFLCDKTGTSQLYRHDLASGETRQLTQLQGDLGRPCWVQGIHTYGFTADGQALVASEHRRGVHRLVRIDAETGAAQPLTELDDGNANDGHGYQSFAQVAVASEGVAAIASAPAVPDRLVYVAHAKPQPHTVRHSDTETTPKEALAELTPLEWAHTDGTTVHGLYAAPTSPHHTGAGLPPAVLLIHGGPTSAREMRYDQYVQFFATRGWATLQVNHRGSTGYGREYMKLLRGTWGVVDVEDSISGAQALVDRGLADPKRLVILGGSAGGFTVLNALADHPGRFAAGVCFFGVSDLFALAQETHKFESRYLDSLVGPLPQASAAYRERSPIFKADRITDALAVFQGTEDKVVPPSQSTRIVASLKERGIPHEYHEYEGEGHGWRKPETIEAFYSAIDDFLKRHVIFQ